MDGIKEQDNELRERFFARWRQLYSEYPYMIHRIIQLEDFRNFVSARPIDPAQTKRVAALPDDVGRFNIQNLTIIGPAIFGSKGQINAGG